MVFGVGRDDGLSRFRHLSADGFSDADSDDFHGLIGSRSRARAHEVLFCQQPEARFSLKKSRGRFGDGFEDGRKIQPPREPLGDLHQSRQARSFFLGLFIKSGVFDGHGGLRSKSAQ